MIAAGSQEIAEIFAGDMGVKAAYVGETKVYIRPGGYIYIQLETEPETQG